VRYSLRASRSNVISSTRGAPRESSFRFGGIVCSSGDGQGVKVARCGATGENRRSRGEVGLRLSNRSYLSRVPRTWLLWRNLQTKSSSRR